MSPSRDFIVIAYVNCDSADNSTILAMSDAASFLIDGVLRWQVVRLLPTHTQNPYPRPALFYPRPFKNFAQPSMMAGLDSISTKMYFNPPTFAPAKKSFQSTMPAPMTTSFLWSSGE